MMRIGIIGAENSHTAVIAKTINVDKKVKGFTVDCVWGETAAFARAAAKAGQIPNIVASPRQMLGRIDALIVDHRHPKHHLKAALPFVELGIPTFVDKPFCFRAAEGKQFLAAARRRHTPVTSFSTLPLHRDFRRLLARAGDLGEIVAGATYGPCDLRSKYGGVFFYGIHQVEMALAAFGYDVSAVLVTRNGNGSTGQLIYPSGRIVTLNFIREGSSGFGVTLIGSKGSRHQPLATDPPMYLRGIRAFTTMFKTGAEPLGHSDLLKPVQVLEAFARSIPSGQKQKVAR